jgi:hypothetical protein
MSVILFPFSYAVSQDPRGFQKNLILSRENRTLLVEFSWGGIFYFLFQDAFLLEWNVGL